jgi:hypothetical protein
MAEYWQMGLNTLTNLASGGAFGSDVARVANVVNPPNVIASPAIAPPPAPVAGQQGTNPAPTATAGHFAQNWGKYAAAGGVILLLVVVAVAARK